MTRSRIISNYILEEPENKDKNSNFQKVPSVIKVPVIGNQDKKIINHNATSNPKEPKLQLTRNNEGVVVGIEVQCTCGETILIKMDY